MTSLVYDDLLTADYTTGTSVTNAIQQEEVDAPTNLTAIALARAIEFRWDLLSYWEQNGISELWANSTDNFATATRIWVGRGNRAVIQKEDVGADYYWVRTAAPGDRVSDTEPATNGLLAAAIRDSIIIPDAFFELAPDQTYWYLSAATPANLTISTSGGVNGGYLQFVGDSSFKQAYSKRAQPFPAVTGSPALSQRQPARTKRFPLACACHYLVMCRRPAPPSATRRRSVCSAMWSMPRR